MFSIGYYIKPPICCLSPWSLCNVIILIYYLVSSWFEHQLICTYNSRDAVFFFLHCYKSAQEWFPFFAGCLLRKAYSSLENANPVWPLSRSLRGWTVSAFPGPAIAGGRSAAPIVEGNQGNLHPNPPITLLFCAFISAVVDKWPRQPRPTRYHIITGGYEAFVRTPVFMCNSLRFILQPGLRWERVLACLFF